MLKKKKFSISLHGKPKYSKNFKHFDYANPNSTIGGTLKRVAFRSFDSFNPFIIKGNPAAGYSLLYETLMATSLDEIDISAAYPLIAESIEVASDSSWIIFNINKGAKWHDGKSITSEDVKFSMDTLKKKGRPSFKSYFKNVRDIEIITEKKIKFNFDTDNNKELPYIVATGLSIIPKHYFLKNKFEETSLTPPLGSGPYKINDYQAGRFVTYKKVENYWGKKLPVNVGRYNFEKIKYDYYRDLTVAREAFKANEFDIFIEYSSKGWATSYKFEAVEKGLVIKEEIKNKTSPGMQALVFNTRKEIFKNRNVRKAIAFAFDFEWLNKNIFYNQYKRTQSFYQNLEFASQGIPVGLEKKYLENYSKLLSKEIFEKTFILPENNKKGDIRNNLKIADNILNKSGWKIINKIRLNEVSKDKLTFEILIVQPSLERVLLPFTKNLDRLGIKVNIRTVDSSQYMQRLNEYDFDMIVTTFPQSFSPGNEQRNFWNSTSGKTTGSRNYAGIDNNVVDELVEKVIFAPNRMHQIALLKALDRILLWNFYVIPQYYSPNNRIAYWDIFIQPEKRPKFGIDILSWWMSKDNTNSLN